MKRELNEKDESLLFRTLQNLQYYLEQKNFIIPILGNKMKASFNEIKKETWEKGWKSAFRTLENVQYYTEQKNISVCILWHKTKASFNELIKRNYKMKRKNLKKDESLLFRTLQNVQYNSEQKNIFIHFNNTDSARYVSFG